MQEKALYLVDSGIDAATNKEIIQVAFECNEKTRAIEFSAEKTTPNHEHGNTILEILKANMHSPARFYSVKILDTELRAYYQQLVCSLDWILDQGYPGIINLSLGVMNAKYEKQVRKLARQLLKKGIYITCAASGEYSLPSVLDEVITVADYRLYNNPGTQVAHKRKIDFVVDVEKYNYRFIPSSSTSYAAPFVSARALELMQSGKIRNLAQLKQKLAEYFARWE